MLTVPVNAAVRAAANGLGGLLGLGETEAERISRQERERIQRAYGNPTASGTRVGPPAPTTAAKTPWLANVFGQPTTPPGTETDNSDAADAETTRTATPPISSAGAGGWGLYVGLGVLVVGGIALVATLMKKRPAPASNRSRNRRRRNAGKLLVKWAPVNQQWFVLWPGQGTSLDRQQVLFKGSTDAVRNWLQAKGFTQAEYVWKKGKQRS